MGVLMGIWTFFKLNRWARWIALLLAAVTALGIVYWKFKRNIRTKVLQEIEVEQLKDAKERFKKEREIREDYKEFIDNLPDDWDIIDLLREEGKIKLPTY